MCELFIGAFFFAMRSCEYIQVSGPWRTKLLTLKNVQFFKGKKLLSHADPLLYKANCVLITFILQKKDSKGDTITQYRSSNKLLCPVKIWSRIIQQISGYAYTTTDTTVNYFLQSDHTVHKFSGKELLSRIRNAAMVLGRDKL